LVLPFAPIGRRWLSSRVLGSGAHPFFWSLPGTFFYPRSEVLTKYLVWVKLPGLSMELWFEKWIGEIGNLIGRTILVDTSFQSSVHRSVAKVPVELDVSEGRSHSTDGRRDRGWSTIWRLYEGAQRISKIWTLQCPLYMRKVPPLWPCGERLSHSFSEEVL